MSIHGNATIFAANLILFAELGILRALPSTGNWYANCLTSGQHMVDSGLVGEFSVKPTALRRNELLAASKCGAGAAIWPDMQKTIAEIIDAAQQGDRSAHYELYQRFHLRVYGLMVRMVGRQDAADLTQQSFLQAFRKLDQFCRQSQFSTWLHRLAINEALQHLRRTKRAKERGLEHEPVDRSTDHCETVDQDDLLDRALALLEPELRATFLLREIDGLAYREIAEVLHIPEGTVGSRMNRARRELKRQLLNLGWESHS